MATFGLVGPLSQIAPVDESIKNVILLIGLAVGVDYSLFYLRRVREERAAGRSDDAAIEAAAATSGRAVLVSGHHGDDRDGRACTWPERRRSRRSRPARSPSSRSRCSARSRCCPALLSMLGDRVDKGAAFRASRRLKRPRGRRSASGRGSSTACCAGRCCRRCCPTGLLVALALRRSGCTPAQPGTDSLPKDMPVVQTFERLQAAFPSETSGMDVVIKAKDVTAPAVDAARSRSSSTRSPQQPEPVPGRPARRSTSAPTRRSRRSRSRSPATARTTQSDQALDVLRDDDRALDARHRSAGAKAYVDRRDGGRARLQRHAEVAPAATCSRSCCSAAFLLLLLTFRSLVVPIKAIVLNLLSVGAAYGAMVLVFQHGWFKSLLGFDATGPIVAWLPLFLFVVLFGLSMDYHVFILSRVREAFDRGMTTEDAVAHGIKSTAGVVTSAAVVMVCVFSVFATLSLMDFKQMGVGLAVAVLLDATLIRGVLLPATMKLLGDRNWWLPKSLHWLPRPRSTREVLPAKA